MTLLPEEASFFFWATAQLAPDVRPVFVERVAAILGAHPIQIAATSIVRSATRSRPYGFRRPTSSCGRRDGIATRRRSIASRKRRCRSRYSGIGGSSQDSDAFRRDARPGL